MTPPRRLIKTVVGAAVVIGVGWMGYGSLYGSKRDALLEELGELDDQNTQYEEAVERILPVRRQIRELAVDALGGSLDQVAHVLRTGLAQMATEAGVVDVTISSESPRGVQNPYVRARGTNRTIRNILKQRADFAIIPASIKATGSLEQTLQLAALAQSQPWLHRVVSVSLKPADKERMRFDVDVRTESLYIPDVVTESRAVVLAPMDPLALDRITPIAMKNVFRYVPDAPRPPTRVVVIDGTPKPPPPPPYHQWRLTGIAMGTSGILVFVSNSSTHEWRTLARGESILGARFLDAQPQQERAVFEIDGKLYEFFTNSVMTDRIAIPESDRPT